MEGGTNRVVRNVENAGGESSTTASNRVVGSIAEEVAFTTATSGTQVMRAGWSQIHAFPRVVTDLASPNIAITSMTLQWTTPGYDGHDGTLQVGSTYFIRVASFTSPDTFSDHRLANLSFSTFGVLPGEVASVRLLGLLPATTYWARIWTTDGDSNFAYASNISTIVMLPSTAPPIPTPGVLLAAHISSVTANWGVSAGANSYLLVASTGVALSPVYASSSTASSTATVSGLEPNTTYFLGVAACNPVCSLFAPLGSTLTFAAPALSLSTTAASSTTISLAWDANGNPSNTRFVVRSSTDNVSFVSAATVTAPSTILTGLVTATTYYLEIVALNSAGFAAAPSNRIGVRTPDGPVPSAIGGVSATAVVLGVRLAWGAPLSTGTGSGFLHYRVARSTNATTGFVVVTTMTAQSYTDKPLTLGSTYYYRVTARDVALVDGPVSATVGAYPFNLPPMEPLGLQITPAPTSVTMSWTPTTRFDNGELFISTSAPLADELIGYSVYRSTEICDPVFVNVSSLPTATTNLVNATGGLNYYYRVYAYNTYGLSANPVTFSSLGERNYFTSDCASRVVLDDATAAGLNAASNNGHDIRIVSQRRPEDIGESVFQSVNWRAMLDGVTELTNYTLPKPMRVVLRFQTSGGVPVPAGAGPSAGTGVAASVKDLGAYWFNGVEFKKVYGDIDPVTQTVTVQSPNLGNYQIRALARSDGPAFDVSNISGRVITPNGDGVNDVVIFTYDPGPNRDAVTGRIYDVTGSYVADMTAGAVPNTLVWNGRANGRIVGSGAYIYRVSGGGRSYTGSMVVAR